MCERKEGDGEGERFRKREMALIHRVFAVSPPALMRIAVKEHACQAAKIDDTVSGGCCEAFLCLLIFPHSSVFLLQALRACVSSSSKTPMWAAHVPFSQFPFYLPHLSKSHAAFLA